MRSAVELHTVELRRAAVVFHRRRQACRVAWGWECPVARWAAPQAEGNCCVCEA